MKKGDLIELEIESAAYEGVAVGRVEDFVVFVRNAVPGDRVRAVVRKKRRKYAEAMLEEMVRPSPRRVEPRCVYFGTCGGCRWQNADYAEQLRFKREQVSELMKRVGGLEDPAVRPTLPSPEIFYYRNKMEFSFGTGRWLTRDEIDSGEALSRDFALGLYIPGRFDKILDLHECHLQSPLSARILNRVRALALEQGWSAYDSRAHTGFLRNLVIRNARHTSDLMVNLVTSRPEAARMEVFRDEMRSAFPEITTLIHSVNETRSPVAAGRESILHGSGTITETIHGLSFVVGPTTFFQTNTLQAEHLYETVRTFAGLKGSEVVYDLYSGIGSIALVLAAGAAQVVGIESQPESVTAAREISILNGIANSSFHAGDAAKALTADFIRQHGSPQVLILDPPRAGLSPQLIQAILETLPPRVIYVSCNPATQARDLKLLCAHYEVDGIQPVDMFPHTYHIENVVSLSC